MCERADSDGHVRIYGEKGKHQKLRLSFFVCVSLVFIIILCTNHRRSAIHWKFSNVPFTLLSLSQGKERRGGEEREKSTKLVVEEVFARIAGARK